MAKIFSGKVYSVSEFPSVGLLKGAFYFNTTTGMCKVAVSETELKDLNISDAYVQIAGETPVTLAQWIANIGQDFNGLEQTVGTKVAIASIHTTTAEGAATADTKVASKAYVDQEVAAAVTGGVEGLASQDWVNQQISPVSEKVTALETKTANIAVSEGATSVDGVAVKARVEAVEAAVSTKVEQSAYNTKMGEIDGALANKLEASDLSELEGSVSALETKTAGLTVVDGKISIDGTSVASSIASKVDQSAYDTKMGQIDGALANKLEASDLSSLNTDVANLKTATTGVTYAGGKTSVDGVSIVEVLNTKAVASEVETALSGKVDNSTYNTKIGELTDLINSKEGQVVVTADKALISDASGKIAASAVSSTELGYLAGVTSNVQEQINAANSAVVTAKGEAIAAAKSETESQIAALGIADYAKTADVEQAISDSAATLQGNIDKKVDQSAYDTKVKALEDAIAAIHTFSVSVVDALPETGADKIIYLVPEKEGSESKAEYLWIEGKWELIGTTHVSLDGYATEAYADGKASAAQAAAEATAAGALSAAKEELQGKIDEKVATETYEAKVEEIEGSIDSIINGSSVESQTVSAGTWKFVSADRSSAVVYEVVDAAASNVYVEVLRGTDFITISGTTVTATAGGAFFVYYLG
jgi:hypothetical protein